LERCGGWASLEEKQNHSRRRVEVNYGTVTKEMCHISFWSLFRKKITLRGMSTLKGFEVRTKERVKEKHQNLAIMANQSRLQKKIAATYGIEEYLKANDHIDRTGTERDGKVVLLPNNKGEYNGLIRKRS
jgi:hypothetical protein